MKNPAKARLEANPTGRDQYQFSLPEDEIKSALDTKIAEILPRQY